MRVGISVLAQSPRFFDGALSQFLQMGELLPEIDPETDYLLLAGGADIGYYRQRTAVHDVVRAGISDRGIMVRIASEHLLLGRACARHKVDVLFYQSAGAVPLVLPSPTKVVLGVWGAQDPSTISLPLSKRIYRKLLNERGLRRVSHLILNSHYTRELITDRYDLDVPTTVIHHGVDERLFYPSRDISVEREIIADLGVDIPYVLFVGQARRYKLLHVLVDAFASAVSERKLPHRLVVVGSFDREHNSEGEGYRAQLIAALARYGLADRVRFLSGIPVSKLRALYAASDLCVQPSASETFGRTVIEAMACGTAVLAARGAATPEVMGEAGSYYEPTDVEGCAEQIALILENGAERQRLVRAGLERVALFSRSRELTQMANVFRHVGGEAPLK